MKKMLALLVALALYTPVLPQVRAQQVPIPPGLPPGRTATAPNGGGGSIVPSHLPLPDPPSFPLQSNTLPPEELMPNGEPKGKLLKTHRKDHKKPKESPPAWADKALKHSKDHLKEFKNAFIVG